LLRPGGVPVEALEAALGQRIARSRRRVVAPDVAAAAPGMLLRHYSPRTPLKLYAPGRLPALATLPQDEALLRLTRRASVDARELALSTRGALTEVARNLFATLRALDRGKKWRCVHVELADLAAGGLAEAINDRLTRAAAPR
jgi:L-threonylcarbamoyladenylate synthase